MNAKTAESILRYFRGGRHDDSDPRIQKAVRFTEGNPELKARFEEQKAFDSRVASAIEAIEPPSDFVEKIQELRLSEGRPINWGAVLKSPAILSVGIALLVMLGWGIYIAMSRMEDFPGREATIRMIDINEDMSGVELEPKSAKVGELEDWLFSKGFDGYYVPAEFRDFKTLGGRVFKQDGFPVAQIAVEKNMLFYAFHADDFGVSVTPADHWRIFQDDDWIAAVRSHEGACFMIAFRGKKADMRKFLATESK